ncbi:MAG: zinc ribbon domain-containing protein [Bacilli bacterium]|nr:zinc ribbon domain-containing protein [Bacilli bacterium]
MNYCEECGNKIKENYNYCANCGFKIKKNNLINNNFSEKEILCDLIEKYIEIANTNDTTLDDYMSIISLIKMLQLQYKEYAGNLQEYIEMFRKNGILDEYQTYFKSTPKKIFMQNNFHPNPDLAENMLYGYFEGCTSRFMNYLILFGLCGKPITSQQKRIMATIFEGNSSSFSKQKIYYSKLYLDDGIIAEDDSFIDDIDKQNYINAQHYIRYRDIANGYAKEKNYKLYEFYMKEASKYNGGAYEDLCRFYITHKNFENARTVLDKFIKHQKDFSIKQKIPYKYRYENKIKPLEDYYNFKFKYPYIRKELLELFDIDIKRFNILVKDIKDNIEYKKNGNYSEKTIEYIKTKLTKESTKN